MSTTAKQPRRSEVSLWLEQDSSLALPPALLTVERPPESLPPHFSRYRVGMVVFQLECSRHHWLKNRPWESPARTVRMASLISQLLSRCEGLEWSFDLLVFPRGTLNYFGSRPTPEDILCQLEVQQVFAALRRARRTVYSAALGLEVHSAPNLELREASKDDGQEISDASDSFIIAADANGSPIVYQRPSPPSTLPGARDVEGIDGPLPRSTPTDGSLAARGTDRSSDSSPSSWQTPEFAFDHGKAVLGGRTVALSLEENHFDEAPESSIRPAPVVATDLWFNPISFNHPGGGRSAGRWPVARIGNILRTTPIPIFLPHYRRQTLEGPFWFAGHPEHCRPHRWQPVAETWLRSRDGRVQLLTFDIRV